MEKSWEEWWQRKHLSAHFSPCSKSSFCLFSIFSSLQDENFLPTKLVFISASPAYHCSWLWQNESFQSCLRPLSLPFPLSDISFTTLHYPYLLVNLTTLPYSLNGAIQWTSTINYSGMTRRWWNRTCKFRQLVQSLGDEWKMRPGALVYLREIGFLTQGTLSIFVLRGILGSICWTREGDQRNNQRRGWLQFKDQRRKS